MKKYGKLIVAAAVLLCGMIFTGCKGLDEIFAGPQDTWFYKQVNYTNKAGNSTKLNVFMCYSEDGFETENHKNIQPGLNVVVTGSTDSSGVIDGLLDDKYIIKNFSNSSKTTVGDSDDDNGSGTVSFKMSKTKWNLMYTFIDMKQKENIPPFDEAEDYEDISNITNISWKQVLADSLVSYLLD